MARVTYDVENFPSGWKTSSFCSESGCVEVKETAPSTGMGFTRWVRGSGAMRRGIIGFTEDEWQKFIAGVKNGEFD